MLTLNSKHFPVSLSFSFQMEWVNPMCYFDKIPGNAGIGIEIPVNEHSRTLFGNPERFSRYSDASTRKFPDFEIRNNGVLFESGTMVITSATSKMYSGWLQSELGVIGEEQRDKFINELDWETDITFQFKAEYDPETDPYCIAEIYNPHFWEGKGASGNILVKYQKEEMLEAMKEEFENFLSNDFGQNVESVINDNPINNEAAATTPFLFFFFQLKKLLALNKFYIRSHPFDDLSDIKNLVIYNNYNIFNPEPDVVTQIEVETFDRRRNWYTPVLIDQIESVSWQIVPFSYADLIPKISFADYLLSVQNHFNIAFHFNADRTIHISDREKIFESEVIDLIPFHVGSWDIGERKNVSLKFVVEYDKNDANFADEFHDLSDRYKDFKEVVDTYNDLLIITSRLNPENDRTLGQIRLVKDENKIYEYKWSTFNKTDANGTEEQINVLQWEYVSCGPQYFIYENGDEIEEIKTSLSTLQMEDSMLSVKQQGNVKSMQNLWSDFSFRLFYYNGGHDGSTVDSTTNNSFNWENENGLFKKRWKKWSRFWSTRQPVTGTFNLPLNMIHFIKNNLHLKYRTVEGEFIIDTVTANLSNNGIGLTTIKAYRL